ncbi:MAG: Cof-type HAD-IIB family hydrolase [Firmicutes bacterium HGW-Firmicutes-8]|nr:MAG: Cof-type HAD-IIB family hydrolase [Firmicutes bacterium HGW-Firmicutes-8]
MPQFKLIAVDLDDTLLDDDLRVSLRTRQALKKAAEKGMIVTIATGRMYRSALPMALDLNIGGPIITYQGALVKNSCSGEVLVDRPVPLDLARIVLAEGYKAGVHMNVYLNDTLLIDSITPEGAGYAKLAQVEMVPVGSLLEFLKNDPTKVLYIADPSLLDRLKGELQKKFAQSLYITKSKPNYLEFMHPQATKGRALKALVERCGIARDETMAFGDSYNDLDMIEFAGMGVAMGNAPEDVKKKADYVTSTNNDDGVAEVIEKYVLL